MRVDSVALHLIPIQTRVPLKFGAETLDHVTCARVAITAVGKNGQAVTGWGETPLSVQWVWPSPLPYAERESALIEVVRGLVTRVGPAIDEIEGDHPVEIGVALTTGLLEKVVGDINSRRVEAGAQPIPHLAGLVCLSAVDIAVHDVFARLHHRPMFQCYDRELLPGDLDRFLQPAVGSDVSFTGRHLGDFLLDTPRITMPAWHLVGGLDALTEDDLDGTEPDDGYPVTLGQWIERDGLTSLKIKLRGNDHAWDLDRLIEIGEIGNRLGVEALTADFNCTVTEVEYVNQIVDQLVTDHPKIHARMSYIEQPFPYDLEANRIDVRSLSDRLPLFLDESAHDWRLVRLGHDLGWTGVALKTCKTQTGALLSACWAQAHGMQLMVQDLTNPMLAQLPHLQLAANVPTIRGVETNGMQFYPEASAPEAQIHPGCYQRRGGQVDLTTLGAVGFGYREGEIDRELPPAEAGWQRQPTG